MKDEKQLSAAIKREISNALGGDTDGELSSVRASAWDYFLGEKVDVAAPEGQSGYISHDLAEVMDWIMPEVIRALGSGEEGVEFASMGEQDDRQAELESSAVAYTFFRENPGILVLHDWLQETFLAKVGYVKCYWDDTPEYETKTFPEVDEAGKASLVMQGWEITSEELAEYETPMGAVQLYEIEAKRETSKGHLVIEHLNSDETLVNSDHRKVSVQDARFVAHRRELTRSELVEMGVKKSIVDDLPTYEHEDDEEDISRYHISDEYNDDHEAVEPSQEKVMVTEGSWLADLDEDGVSERHEFLFAGGKVLEIEESEDVNIIAMASMPLAGKHLGRSLYDKVKDIQELKTAIMRQRINNHFLVNNARVEVVRGKVTISDLLNNRAGGIIRVKEPGMMREIQTPILGPEAQAFSEYVDKIREERTGVGPEIVTELGELANSTAWGIERLMAKKEELVGLILAILRATGFNELFEHIHKILRENADGPMLFQVEDQWVQQDPRQWPKRKAVPPQTWSGMGDKIQRQKVLQTMVGMQEKLAASEKFSWMVSAEEVFKTVNDFTSASGMKARDYVIDPQSPKGQMALMQHQQMMAQQSQDGDILANAEKVKGEYQMQMKMLESQTKQQIEGMKQQLTAVTNEKDFTIQQLNSQIKAMEAAQKDATNRDKIALDEMNNQRKAELDQQRMDLDEAKTNANLDIEKYRIDKGAETQLLLKQMEIEADAAQSEKAAETAKQGMDSNPTPGDKGGSKGGSQSAPVINIVQGGKKRVRVQRNEDGSLEGTAEDVDDE